MKKFGRRLLALGLGASMLLGAGSAGASAADAGSERMARLRELSAQYPDFLGLTQEQRLEDFDYLWETLRTSYPFWGVTERQGVDLAAAHDKLRARIENSDSDFDFYLTINDLPYTFNRNGHLMFFGPSTYEAYREMYQSFKENGVSEKEFLDHFAPWLDVILGEDSIASYERTKEPEEKLIELLSQTGAQFTGEEEETPSNLTAELLSGSTAYIKVNQMLSDYTQDWETLSRFYERAKECKNLIIDISENGGGSDWYWQNLLVAPNIDKPMSWAGIMLFSDTPNNRPYIEKTFDASMIHPIAELPDLPNLHKDDRARATHYIRETQRIDPATPGEKAFEGKIWLLVGPQVYSSSESFATFCKRTGFATLVGTPTGGDGFGVDPIYCVLPNSKYIVRYSMLAGLNSDGRNNEEYGTFPDITQRKDETALDACLRAIAGA